MPFWSDKAQVEPLAALAAVLAVCVGLTLYVGAVETALLSVSPDREVAPTAADHLVASASSFGVVELPLDDAVTETSPAGYELNATLTANETSWMAGPNRSTSSECVTRRVSVRLTPATVRPGRMEVCVWPAA